MLKNAMAPFSSFNPDHLFIFENNSIPVSVIVMVRDGCVTEASEIWKKFLIEWRGKFDDKDWEAS